MRFIDLFIRTILVSVPEQSFLILFVIAFLGKSCKLRQKSNKKYLISFILLQSIISNMFRIFKIDDSIVGPIFILLELIIVFCIIERKDFAKIVLFSFMSILVIMATESVCINIILYSTHLKVSDFNNNAFTAFIASLFERSIQYLFLYLVYAGKFKLVNGRKRNIFEVLISTPQKRKITIVFSTICIGYMIAIGQALMFYKMLSGLPSLNAIIICSFALAMPAALLFIFAYSAKQNCLNNDAYVNLLMWEMKCRAEAVLEAAEKSNDPEIKSIVSELIMEIETAK